MSGTRRGKAPQMAIRRLSMYYRTLAVLQEQGVESVSSERLAALNGSTAAQVRRDLAYFGSFGRRGVGYDVDTLRAHVQQILGIGEGWPMALVGVGNLGSALLAYDGFPRQGFRIVEAFDSDPRRVGAVIRDVVVKPLDHLKDTIQERQISMALVAVPARAAQAVSEQLIEAGVRCLLNFAPVALRVPSGVYLASVDLSIEVEYLSYLLRESVAENGGFVEDAAPGAGSPGIPIAAPD